MVKRGIEQSEVAFSVRLLEQLDLAADRYKESEKQRVEALKSVESKGLESVEPESRIKLRNRLIEVNDSFGLERVLGVNDLLQINYLSRGLKAAKSICRIHIRNHRGIPSGYGTGFMVSPSLMLTNHHVLPDSEYARRSYAEFNYEMNEEYEFEQPHSFEFSVDRLFYANKELDFALVAVKPLSRDGISLSEFGFLQLIEESGKALTSEHITIIQHPEGADKHLAIRNNKILGRFDHVIHYETDTMPGSSGSPVLNDHWDVVALHHSGVAKRNTHGRVLKKDGKIFRQGDALSSIDWIANEGIRISALFAHLKEQEWSSAEARFLEELGTFSDSNLNESMVPYAGAKNIITGERGTKQPNLPSVGQIKLGDLIDKLGDEQTTEQDIAPYFKLAEKTRGIDPLFEINHELVVTDAPELQESALLLNSANWICKRSRHKVYEKKIQQIESPIKIISEGDSWFQYPFILNDVIDHLMEVKEFAILSFGEAGDKIRDIVAKAEFMSALDSERPEFFLISGGGNDLVAGEGLKNYVKSAKSSFDPKHLIDRIAFERFKARLASDYTNLFSIILQAQPYIKIIFHGYSYPIPNAGHWLGEPLAELGITDTQVQTELIRLMFDELNQLFERTASSFPKSVHYLDIRNLVPTRGWYDELHPTNPFYGDVAAAFKEKIWELKG